MSLTCLVVHRTSTKTWLFLQWENSVTRNRKYWVASPIELNRNTSCFIFTWFETIASIYSLLVYSRNRPNINILSSFFYSTTSTEFAHWHCIYTVQRQFSKMYTIYICKQCLNHRIMLFFFIHCSPTRTKTTLKNHLLVASVGQWFCAVSL